MAHETRRLLQAATALHTLLQAADIPHAFYGGFVVSLLASSPRCNDISCIVDGGSTHPFRQVRQVCSTSEEISTKASPWTNRLYVTYTQLIPAVDIEILPAGEAGPRRLDRATVMTLAGIPVLTYSELIRAKLKSWSIRQDALDAEDIIYVMTRYWDRIDINRVPEQDMKDFARLNPTVAPAWLELRRKYGLAS